MEEKLLTIAIPCYNSQGYMRHAVDSLLHVQEGLEILIIDDGSTDDTALIADDYARRYPDTIRSLHQRNGGHGRAVMSGFQYARGTYFKVLDSDDWMDAQALDALMRLLKELRRRQLHTDMIITNYVYEKTVSTALIAASCTPVWPTISGFAKLMMMTSYLSDLIASTSFSPTSGALISGCKS